MSKEKLEKYNKILSEFEIAKMYGPESDAKNAKLLAILLPFIEDEFKEKIEKLRKAQ
jgi:hypothetical protein